MDIFNIKIEFDHDAFRQAVESCIAEKGKGYVCVIDGNVLTVKLKNGGEKILNDTHCAEYIASLIKDTDKTNIIGINAVSAPNGDIAGIH